MGIYSINDIEKLSGIKAHTIRIWEKRYNLFQPKRTETNIRYYTDETLKQIINIASLNNHGVKISKIAALSSDQIQQQVLELNDQKNNHQVHIDQLVIAMLDLNEAEFDKLINELTGKYGFTKTVTDVIYPFLDKIGILWTINQIHPAHEHFISNLIRQKLIAAIDTVTPSKQTTPKTFLLFLPEHELHEIGLLFYHYLIKVKGHKVIYLGQTVPYADLKMIATKYHVDELMTAFVCKMSSEEFSDYLKRLSKDFPQCTINIIGRLTSLYAEAIPTKIFSIQNPTKFYNRI